MNKTKIKYNSSLSDIQVNAHLSFDKYLFSSIKHAADLDELQVYWMMQACRMERFSLSPSTYNFLALKLKTTPRRIQRIIEKSRRKGLLMRRTKAGWCKRIGWRKVSAILEREHGGSKEEKLARRWIIKVPTEMVATWYSAFRANVVDTSIKLYFQWTNHIIKDNQTACWYREVGLASDQGGGSVVISHRHLSAISPIKLGSVKRLLQEWRSMVKPGITMDVEQHVVSAASPLGQSMPAHLTRSCKPVREGSDGSRKGWVVGTRVEFYSSYLQMKRIRQPNLLELP